jgi:hypothetical protein
MPYSANCNSTSRSRGAHPISREAGAFFAHTDRRKCASSDSYRCTYLLTPFSGDAQGSSGSHSAIVQHHGKLMRVRDNHTLGETFHMETAIDPQFGISH